MVFVGLLVIAASLTRILPHPPNFTAVAALALFAGALMPHRLIGIVLPIIAMLFTDLILGFHNTMLPVYASMIIISLIGSLLVKQISLGRVFLASLISSLLFFVITNGAVWQVSGMYPNTLSGLMACYSAAIPFFGNTIAGDLFFNTVLFGSYFLAFEFTSQRNRVA